MFDSVDKATGDTHTFMRTEPNSANPADVGYLLQGGFSEARKASLDSDYLVKGLLGQGEYSVLWGASGSGKTFATIDLAAHIAMGKTWNGRRVRKTSVLYVCTEGEAGFRKRLRGYSEYHGDPEDLHRSQFEFIADAPAVVREDDHKALIKTIQAFNRKHGSNPGLIVLDTLARTFGGGDENSAKDMNAFNEACAMLAKESGAHVMVIHHTGKVESNGMRGSSSLFAALDASLSVQKKADGHALSIDKCKDGVDGISFGFKLAEVTLGQDSENDLVTTLVAIPAEIQKTGAKRQLRKTSQAGKALKPTLDFCLTTQGETTVENPFCAPHEVAVTQTAWVEKMIAKEILCVDPDSEKLTESSRRAKDRLLAYFEESGFLRRTAADGKTDYSTLYFHLDKMMSA